MVMGPKADGRRRLGRLQDAIERGHLRRNDRLEGNHGPPLRAEHTFGIGMVLALAGHHHHLSAVSAILHGSDLLALERMEQLDYTAD
jgi:hypothetical protein